MNILLPAILKLMKEFEEKLEGEYHVGLTGSALYGQQHKKNPDDAISDVDIIIYPHSHEDGSEAPLNMDTIVELLDLRYVKTSPPSVDQRVYKVYKEGMSLLIDIFPMRKVSNGTN